VTSRALRVRRDCPELFTGYRPMAAEGPAAGHAVAFDRGGAVTVATRLPVGLSPSGGWQGTVLTLPWAAADLPPGLRYPAGPVPLAGLLTRYPVALLARN